MDIFSLITLIGGLAFFLYGMNVMSGSLEKMAGGKLELIIKKMTAHPLMGLLLGAGITVAIQSSSAMTVMLVGLVNSGIMQLGQTLGLIMGSNIGTTLTAWILSLAGIETENVFIKLLKPEYFSPIFALIGIILIMGSKRVRRKNAGEIMVGFAILMYGMELMSSAVSPLRDMPEFSSILTAFTNPFLGVLVGAVFTGIIQSSAASVGILQALSLTGCITYGIAIPIIMGQNIGTCVTAVLSSIGVSRNAKRVAAIHMSFNIIGTIIGLTVYYIVDLVFALPLIDQTIGALGIAICHSIFNIVTTAVLLPIGNTLVKLAYLLVPDKAGKNEAGVFLDERLLLSPSFAVNECSKLTKEMAVLAMDTFLLAVDQLQGYEQTTADLIEDNEDKLDIYEDKLGTFLVKISGKELSEQDSREVSKLLHSIGDFERIGDHAVNLLGVARELNEKQITFSDEAKGELSVLTSAIKEIIDKTKTSFSSEDIAIAGEIEPLEEVVDFLSEEIKTRHVDRLQTGKCTIKQGFVLSDLLNNYERVSDHCSNIAVCLIETARGSFDTHEYLSAIKAGQDNGFADNYRKQLSKYRLPERVRE